MEPSVAEWLASRTTPPPANLLTRMITELERLGVCREPISSMSLADAGNSILKTLDERGCTDRLSALDLLAADALFTYAFEAASDSRDTLQETSRNVLEKVTSK